MDYDPGEGTSDGRVMRNQRQEQEVEIKQEIDIKDELKDDDIHESPQQPMEYEANDTIKSENDSDDELDLDGDNDLLMNEVKCEKDCKKENLDSTKDKNPVDYQNTPKMNRDNNGAKRHVKQDKQRALRRRKNKKASKKRAEDEQRKKHKCHLCNYKTSQKENLIVHIRTHTGERPFKCKVCAKRFTTNGNLKCHQKNHGDQFTFRCFKCNKRFANDSEKHSHEQHNKCRRFECFACQYKTYNSGNLKGHMKCKHTGEKQFQCAVCPMKFVHKGNLKQHLATHAKKRPIRCSKCCRNFPGKDEREQHEEHCNRHHYECFMCKFNTRFSENLKDHVRAHHTGEKPFQCKMCNGHFAGKKQLNMHMKRKHIANKEKSILS